jgi:hypothetical protein
MVSQAADFGDVKRAEAQVYVMKRIRNFLAVSGALQLSDSIVL